MRFSRFSAEYLDKAELKGSNPDKEAATSNIISVFDNEKHLEAILS